MLLLLINFIFLIIATSRAEELFIEKVQYILTGNLRSDNILCIDDKERYIVHKISFDDRNPESFTIETENAEMNLKTISKLPKNTCKDFLNAFVVKISNLISEYDRLKDHIIYFNRNELKKILNRKRIAEEEKSFIKILKEKLLKSGVENLRIFCTILSLFKYDRSHINFFHSNSSIEINCLFIRNNKRYFFALKIVEKDVINLLKEYFAYFHTQSRYEYDRKMMEFILDKLVNLRFLRIRPCIFSDLYLIEMAKKMNKCNKTNLKKINQVKELYKNVHLKAYEIRKFKSKKKYKKINSEEIFDDDDIHKASILYKNYAFLTFKLQNLAFKNIKEFTDIVFIGNLVINSNYLKEIIMKVLEKRNYECCDLLLEILNKFKFLNLDLNLRDEENITLEIAESICKLIRNYHYRNNIANYKNLLIYIYNFIVYVECVDFDEFSNLIKHIIKNNETTSIYVFNKIAELICPSMRHRMDMEISCYKHFFSYFSFSKEPVINLNF